MLFYLFEDLYSLLPDDMNNPETKLKGINKLIINYNKVPFLIILYNHLNKLLYKFTFLINANIDKKTILFQNRRALYLSIPKNGSNFYNIILLGDNLLSFYYFIKSLHLNVIYFPVYHVYNLIYTGILKRSEIKLSKSIDILKEHIKKLDPDLIVLHEDGNTEGRSLALIANELNIPTITVQDGMFNTNNKIIYGHYSEYMFVWGQYFKDAYLDQNIKDDTHIKILGYPHKLTESKTKNHSKRTVCYLGQNYEFYNKSYLNIKIGTIQKLKLICDKLGFDFFYRPHPNEDRNYIKSKVKNIQFSKKSDSLYDSIEKGDVFISFNSTSVIEANLNLKIGIQLKNYDIKTDDFEKMGVCSKTCHNFKELESYLKKIAENKDLFKYFKPVNPYYIQVTSNPEIKFLKLIKELI